MSSIARKSNTMNIKKIALMVFSLLLFYPVLAIAYSDTNLSSNPGIGSSMSVGATIAFFGDSEPASSSDVAEITKDLNQVIPLSPTGRVDAIFFMGDMTKLSLTLQAVEASNVKNVPVYFVIGNHEAGSNSETAIIQGRYSTSIFPLNPGPAGTDKTTYSMNVGNIHIINMNEYWNGATDDSYLKYSSSMAVMFRIHYIIG